MRISSTVVFLVAGPLLTACGGGGGGGGGTGVVMPVPFTSFDAVKSGQPVKASGISQTANATTVGDTVQSVTVNAVDTAGSSATLTYGTLPAISAISFTTPTSSASWSGSDVECDAASGICGGANSSSLGVVINPRGAPAPALAWNYQSFGYWLVTVSNTSTVGGAMSFGSPTPVAGVPIMGTATYTGLSSGAYVDPAGTLFVHGAQMVSNVDFVLRTVGFSTSNTTIAPANGGTTTLAPELDLTGILTYQTGSNQFEGAVTTPGGGSTPAMTGNAKGQFYGPTAQEIGGVYSLTGSGPQTMLGGFGGKRP